MLAQTTTYEVDSGVSAGLYIFIFLGVVVLYAIAAWQLYVKAGQPGWAALIPFYNWYVLLKIVGRPGWWLILFFIPFVNIVVWIIVYLDLAKSFGKGVGFALGLIFLSFIFLLILSFGSAQYVGPAGAMGPGSVPPPPPPTPA
jgi:hypothetical protein